MTGEELLCKLNMDLKDTRRALILSDIPKEVDITRKQSALIIHEYIKRVSGEEDEADVEAALVLKDLYDCRICAKHIAQVFVKGIMKPFMDKPGLPVLFGGNEKLTEDEALVIIDRIFNKEKRF